MIHVRNAVAVCLALSALSGDSVEAMVRKCRATPGGVPIRTTTPLLMIDGVAMGDYTAPPQAHGALAPDITVLGSLKREEIVRVDIVCLEIVEAGEKVARSVISVITRVGAVPFMRSHLQALVHQQEEYRRRTGSYARDLASLGFFASRAPLAIEMQLADGGWSAKAQLATVPTGCQVVVTREAARRGDAAVVCLQG